MFQFAKSTVGLIGQYLSERTIGVSINDVESEPRGWMFINDLPLCLEFCKCHLYADDAQGATQNFNFTKSTLNKPSFVFFLFAYQIVRSKLCV